jgi:chromosome segregation ATPase
MIATLTEKEDQIEELQEELGSERSLNEQKSQTLAQISKENANLQEISSSLELELAGATQSLEQVRLLNDQKDETISDLSGLNSHKEEQIQRLQSQEERLRDELGSLEASVSPQTLTN